MYAHMRTTIEFPDALFREAKRLALERGETLRVLITRAMDRELAAMKAESPPRRHELPAIEVAADAPILGMSGAELAGVDQAADVERVHGRVD
jgi:hypothetical protein